MKHILRTALCAVLILVMAVGTGLSAFAAGEDQYISEIRIEYGDAGKQALKKAGYTVQNNNLNQKAEFNNGDSQTSVWMGYKTTNNPDDAITDMGVINMKGDYSFTNYEAVLESQKEGVANMTKVYMAAIDEFKANYAEGRASALYAHDVLNLVYEDDSKQCLGDFFLTATEAQIQTVFLEGNSEILALAHQAVALGLADEDGDTIFTRLEDMDIDDEDAFKRKLAVVVRDIYDAIPTIQAYLKEFYKEAEKVDGELTYDKFSEHINKNGKNIPEATLSQVVKGLQIWVLSKDVNYAGSDLSLLDILMMDKNELSDYWLNPLAAALTDGQAACFSSAGLYQVLASDFCGQDEYSSKIESFSEENKDKEPISVYAGIDRRIFEPDGIALMEEASKASNNNSGHYWTDGHTLKSDLEYDLNGAIVLLAGVTLGVTLGIVFATLAYKWVVSEVYVTFAQSFSHVFMSGGTGTIFFAVAIAAVVICLAVFLLEYVFGVIGDYKELKQKLIDKRYDHSRKPEILVTHEEDVNGGEFYGYYYAVRMLDDSIADINGGDTRNPEWNVMYVTKDRRLGDPIIAKFNVQTQTGVPKGWSPIHNFTKNGEGIKPAANLNYGLVSAYGNIFMYVQHKAVGAAELTGSVFSSSTVMLIALAAFLVGGGLGGGVVLAKGKKKREQTA